METLLRKYLRQNIASKFVFHKNYGSDSSKKT